ncbi:MAG TPA: hypothetical protein VH062_23445 [Polyangiaceae bacterium]|nr:hypothetical protein [Polyangiaceae bacterium]
MTLPGAKATSLIIDNEECIKDVEIVAGSVRLRREKQPAPDATLIIQLQKRLVSIDAALLTALIGLAGTLISVFYSKLPATPAVVNAVPLQTAAQQQASIQAVASPSSAGGPVACTLDNLKAFSTDGVSARDAIAACKDAMHAHGSWSVTVPAQPDEKPRRVFCKCE